MDGRHSSGALSMWKLCGVFLVTDGRTAGWYASSPSRKGWRSASTCGMGMRRPTAACSMCEMGEGSAERITSEPRDARSSAGTGGGDQAGANCRVMEDSRETTLA